MRRLLALIVFPFLVSGCGGGGGTPSSPTPAANCTITVPQTTMNVTATGGASAIPVTAGTTCAWTVTSNQPWLTITSGTGGTGAASVTFTVAENTGEARTATVTIGGVAVAVTQAAAPPPIVFNPAPPNPVVNTAYTYQFTATGGAGSFTYSLETGVGFPPIGIVLSPSGSLAGTTTSTSPATFGVCATDTTGRSVCRRVTLTPAPATTGGAANGNWSGTIVLTDGCTTPLPMNYPWTGTFRAAASGGTELVVSVPRAFVFSEVIPVTITGQQLSFTIDFDGPYRFVANFSADFRSLNGTFTGSNCSVPPVTKIPTGTWTGTKQ